MCFDPDVGTGGEPIPLEEGSVRHSLGVLPINPHHDLWFASIIPPNHECDILGVESGLIGIPALEKVIPDIEVPTLSLAEQMIQRTPLPCPTCSRTAEAQWPFGLCIPRACSHASRSATVVAAR